MAEAFSTTPTIQVNKVRPVLTCRKMNPIADATLRKLSSEPITKLELPRDIKRSKIMDNGALLLFYEEGSAEDMVEKHFQKSLSKLLDKHKKMKLQKTYMDYFPGTAEDVEPGNEKRFTQSSLQANECSMLMQFAEITQHEQQDHHNGRESKAQGSNVTKTMDTENNNSNNNISSTNGENNCFDIDGITTITCNAENDNDDNDDDEDDDDNNDDNDDDDDECEENEVAQLLQDDSDDYDAAILFSSQQSTICDDSNTFMLYGQRLLDSL